MTKKEFLNQAISGGNVPFTQAAIYLTFGFIEGRALHDWKYLFVGIAALGITRFAFKFFPSFIENYARLRKHRKQYGPYADALRKKHDKDY